MADVRNTIIIGSGPAGYAAGIYMARAELVPLLLAGEKSGGQLMLTTDVENYPGFAEGKMGPELMAEMRQQAERFGTEMVDTFVTAVDFSSRPFKIWTAVTEGKSMEDLAIHSKPEEFQSAISEVKKQPHAYEAKSVVLATGAISILLGLPGESEHLGRGVSTCAVCDAAFFREKNVYLVGGGDAAMEDVLALVKFASTVTLIHRRDELRASKIMQRRVLEDNKDKVKVLWNSEVLEVKGDGQRISGIRVKNNRTGEKRELPADGLFVAIGHKPMTQVFRNEVRLDEKGYIVTRLGLDKQSVELAESHINVEGKLEFPTMTSVEGVFAAGDVVDFRYKQAITAAGFGTMAALDAEWWLQKHNT